MTEEEQLKKLTDVLDRISDPCTKYLFVLDGKKVVPCEKLSDWGELIRNPQARTVDITILEDVIVSTVFVGMQAFEDDEDGRPMVFETMIFGGEHDGYCDKYSTWERAEEGHKVAVKLVEDEKLDE